jgi:hypothetical protein
MQNIQIIKPNYIFNNYYDLLNYLKINNNDITDITVYFKRKNKTFEQYKIKYLKEIFPFPSYCILTFNNKNTKEYHFNYTLIEDFPI